MINQLFRNTNGETINELPYTLTCDKCGGNVRLVPTHHQLDIETGHAAMISLSFRCTKCGQKDSIIIDESEKKGE